MSKLKKKIIKCNDCGEEFDVDMYDSINVSLDPDLKEKIWDESLYEFVCPKCGKKLKVIYPFLYNDMNKGFMIHQGSLYDLIEYKENVLDKFNKNMDENFPNVFNNVLNLGTTSYYDFRSKICALENGLDYRISTIYQVRFEKFLLNDLLKEYKDEDIVVDNSYLDIVNGELCVVGIYRSKKNRNIHGVKHYTFNKETYEKLESDYKEKLDGVYDFCFNTNIAKKFLRMLENEEEYNNTVLDYVILELFNGNKNDAVVPLYNKGKFKEGDEVIICYNDYITKGRIEKLFSCSRIASPFESEDAVRVAFKPKIIQADESRSSNEELNNKKLKNMLINYVNNKDYIKEDVLEKSNLLLGFHIIMDFNKTDDKKEIEKALKFLNGDLKDCDLPPKLLRSWFDCYKDDDGNYLSVYLEQGELTEKCTRLVYNFEDVVDIVINNPEKYKGIIFNPKSDKIKFDSDLLIKHKYLRIMENSNRMRELIPNFTEKEISSIGEINYNLIKKAYFEKTSPEKMAEELGIEKDVVGDCLDKGYEEIMKIIVDNY